MTTKNTARRSAAPRRRSARRMNLWLGISVAFNSVADAGRAFSPILDLRAANNLHLIGATVVRIHGEYGARVTPSANMASNARVSAGLILVQGDALDQGAAGMPDPDLDVDAQWLWHGDLLLQGDGTNDAAQMRSMRIDNQSMRKLQGNTALALVLTNQANATIDAGWIARYLVKLA